MHIYECKVTRVPQLKEAHLLVGHLLAKATRKIKLVYKENQKRPTQKAVSKKIA